MDKKKIKKKYPKWFKFLKPNCSEKPNSKLVEDFAQILLFVSTLEQAEKENLKLETKQ